MPQPSFQEVHVNAPLSNISVAFLQDAGDYIADKVFPVIPVPKASNIYFSLDKGFWFRDEAAIRVDGEESAGSGYGVTQKTYSCDAYALHFDVGPMVRANQDNPLDADTDATLFLTQRLAITRERKFLSNFFATSKWTGSTTGGDITPNPKWDTVWKSDGTGSIPLEDIEAQQFAIKKNTGFWPNKFVVGTSVYKALKNNAEIVARYQYTQAGVITPELIARVISPPNQPESGKPNFEVLVASSVYNSGKEGQADSMGFTATATDALLCYAAPNPGVRIPSAGYIFTWTPIAGYTATIKRIAMPWLGSSADGQPTVRIEAEMSFAMNQVAPELGAYFSAATS